MKKFDITNSTAGLISIAYNGSNGILKFVDIMPYSLMQTITINEEEEESFMKSFAQYEGRLSMGKMKADKAKLINETNENKRLKKVEETYGKEVKKVEDSFNVQSDGDENSLEISIKPKTKGKK